MKTKHMMVVGMLWACALPVALRAQVNSYTNAGSGAWDAAANWSAGFAPSNSDSVFITNGAYSVALTNTTAATWMTVSNLTVSGSGGLLVNFTDPAQTFTVGSGTSYGATVIGSGVQAGTLTSSNGNLSVGTISLGSAGRWNVLGGTNSTRIWGGGASGVLGAGSVLLNGGVIQNGNGEFNVGLLTVSNGTLNTGVLGVGDSSSGPVNGVLHMDGGTVNVSPTYLVIGRMAGDTGTVIQTAGTLNSPTMTYLGFRSVGTYILSNGTFSAGPLRIASDVSTGRGSLCIFGGTNTISGPLNVGAIAGAAGSVLVANSGLLEFTTSGAITNGLSTGVGTITNQNGGTIQFDVNPTIAVNNGSFVVTNATIAFKGLANAAVTGAITNITVQAGSRLRLDTSTNASGLAGFNVGGAGNYAQLELTGTNALWQSASLTINSGGTLVGNASASVAVTGGLTNMGTVVLSNQFSVVSGANFYGLGSSNTFAKGVGVASGATLEITNSTASVAGTLANSGVMRVSGNSTLSASNIVLASGSQWIVSGGTNTTSAGSGSYGVSGAGSVILNGGVLSVTNLGTFGVGSLAVSNGILNSRYLTVGDVGTAPQGVMRMDGGTVNVSGVTGYLVIGRSGGTTGTVVQSGGLISSPTMTYIGIGDGTYTLSNGTLNAGPVRIASDSAAGRGRLNIYGGTNTISGVLNVGAIAGATGSVLVSDSGLLEFTTSGVITNGLSTGAGTITNQNGGTIQFDVNPTMVINNGSFVVTNATIAFKGVSSAAVGSVTNNAAGVTVQANSRLRLDTSTNAILTGFTVGGVGNYAQLELTNSLWQSTNLTVASEGALLGTNGRFALYGNFINQSTNRSQFDLSRSTVFFTSNGLGISTHTLSLSNSAAVDMGVAGNAVQLATNFSIGTLSIALSNNLTVTGTKSGALTNALYVGWLDLSAWNTNAASLSATLSNALTLADINLYYDAGDARNAYLQDASYNIWGGGLLIPIPEPSTTGLILGGALLSAWLLRRRRE